MGEDETSKADGGDDDVQVAADEDSFIQVKRNIDDENAEAAEMARLEAQSDKDMGEDNDDAAETNGSGDASDDENAEAAEMARLEAQSDKDIGEDNDDAAEAT